MLSHDECSRLIAHAYYDAALANADMHDATDALEVIRVALIGEADHFKVWETIDHYVGRAEHVQFQKVLTTFRDHFEHQIRDTEIARLGEVLSKDAESGWLEWLLTYAKTQTEWRLRLCLALCEATLPFPERFKQNVYHLKQLAQYGLHGRREESYDHLFTLLSKKRFPIPCVPNYICRLLTFNSMIF